MYISQQNPLGALRQCTTLKCVPTGIPGEYPIYWVHHAAGMTRLLALTRKGTPEPQFQSGAGIPFKGTMGDRIVAPTRDEVQAESLYLPGNA